MDASSKLYLIDYSKMVCDYWRNKRNAKLHVIHCQNTRLSDIPDQSVDLVMSFDVFVHLDVEPFFGYMSEAYRILKPSGIALIDYLSLDDSTTARWFLRELEKQDTFGLENEVKRAIFRVHHHESIQVLAEAIGFSFANVEDAWRTHNVCTLTKP